MTLLDSLNIGASGLKAHGLRMDVHAKNIANIDTPNYVRKIPILYSKDDASFEGMLNRIKENVFQMGALPHVTGGVDFGGVVEDPTESDRVYKPGHPDADEYGYIQVSNVNPMIDIADAHMTSRAYEASMAVVTITKAMTQKAAEIGKG